MMNKIIAFLVVVLIIICGIGVAVYFRNPNTPATQQSEENSSNTAEATASENTVSGVVVKISEDKLGIDDDGVSYEFNITNAEKPEEKIEIDDTVEVTYKNSDQEELEASKVTISTDKSETDDEENTTNTTNSSNSSNSTNSSKR